MKTHLSFFAALFALLLCVQQARANTYRWNDKSPGGHWSTASNWLPNGTPGVFDDVIIGAVSGAFGSPVIIVDIPVSVSSVSVSTSLTLVPSGSGSLTTKSLTLSPGGSIVNQITLAVNNGSIFFNSSTSLSNSGTINVSASTIKMGSFATFGNSFNGTCTVNGGSTIDFAANAATSATISNGDGGTFYAGTSNSVCTINLNYQGANIQNSGNFYVGSTSVINLTGSSTRLNNTGTFTLQSDANGSAAIGNISGAGATVTGIYNVQRYISGGSSSYRTYRLLSSPVFAANIGGNNVYSLNFVQLTSLITGSNGIPGGFDKAGNPTLYLYRDDVPFTNSSFVTGNFRGISDISAAPSYSVDIDGSGFSIPVGNGFWFFFRGDRTNPSAKFTAGTSAESVTMTISGTLNTGQITVKPWFKPSSSNLDYTKVAYGSGLPYLTLAGNPYPSSIDWETYNTNSPNTGIYAPNVSPIIYIFNPTNRLYETYKAGVGGTKPNGNIIPTGQGFFVTALNSSAQLVFNESAKTNGQATAAIGNLLLGPPPQSTASQTIRFQLVKDSINTDAILINFDKGAAPEYSKGKDAPYLNGSGVLSLSALSADNIALAIYTRALPNLTPVSIPLNITATSAGNYQLNLDKLNGIPQLFDVLLIDNYSKDSVNLKSVPKYNFNINTGNAATYGSKRFSLLIRQNAAYAVQLLNFNASKSVNVSQIVWSTQFEENYTNFTVQRSTDNGASFQVLASVPSSGLGTYSFVDNAPAATANQYRLKMEDLNGTVTYSNIVTLSYAELAGKTIPFNRISLYPNPANMTLNVSINPDSGFSSNSSALQGGNSNALIANNQTTATTYELKIFNINGALVKSTTISQPSWQGDVGSLAPGTYIIRIKNNSDNSVVGTNSFIKL